MSSIAPPPISNDLVSFTDKDPSIRGKITPIWANWLQLSLLAPVQSSSQLIGSVTKTAQTAAILTTPIPLASLSSGRYRITWYARVTAAAAMSSSFQVTLGWTETGVAQTFVGALANGNLTTTNQSQSFMAQIDQATALSYAVAYASNPGGAMAFRISLIVESV